MPRRGGSTADGSGRRTDERGTVLLITAVAMLLLFILALSFTAVAKMEGRIGVNHYALVKALHVADAGIEGIKRELTDSVNASGWSGTWSPVLNARGTLCNGANSVTFNTAPSGGATWARTGAAATLFVRNNVSGGDPGDACADTDGIITIRATGRLNGAVNAFAGSRPLAVDVAWNSGSAWDSAVNGGSGAPGAVIQGNAVIYGSVQLLSSLGSIAWAMGGGSEILNNYLGATPPVDDLPAAVKVRINPVLRALGDQALNASFMVKQGLVTFGGGATAGIPEDPSNGRKDTLDMALASDFDPATVPQIYADRTGLFATAATFPRLSDLVPGDPSRRTWEGMLQPTASGGDAVLVPSALLNGGTRIDGSMPGLVARAGTSGIWDLCRPTASTGSGCVDGGPTAMPNVFFLTMNTGNSPELGIQPQEGALVVRGKIVFTGFGTTDLEIGQSSGPQAGRLTRIIYSGAATIFVDDSLPGNGLGGRLHLQAHFHTANGAYPTADNPLVFPPVTTNNIAFMTERTLLAGNGAAQQLELTALFYAQAQIQHGAQNAAVGSLFSQSVDLGSNVPRIAAVRAMSRFLPPGVIGGASGPGTLSVIRWREGTQ